MDYNKKPREKWIEQTLANISAGSRILDAGAGELDKKKYCSHLEYVAQDFGQYDGNGDSTGLQTSHWDQSKLDIISDITDIPVESSSFDAVMCIEVLEHLPDPIAALKELHRVLKPEGRIVLTAPFCSLTHFAPFHFSTGFNKYWYQEHLDTLGFEILELESNGNFFHFLHQEVGRVPAITGKYNLAPMNVIEKYAHKIISRYLSKIAPTDQTSDELLCFGYHILAQKK